MIINHNIAALNTYRQFGAANAAQGNSMEKLSSGLRINRAGDDAAGLAISEKMRGQIRGLDMAAKNSQDGISLIQTAEGALNETHDILQRMRELAVQASNDTSTDTDRAEIQKEVDQLTSEIDRIANTTEFNTKKLLDGSATGQETTAQTAEILGQNAKTFSISAQGSIATSNEAYYIEIVAATTTANGFKLNYQAANSTTVTTFSFTAGGSLSAISGVVIDIASTAKVGDAAGIMIKSAVNNTANNSFRFQIGANSGQNMSVDIKDMRAAALNVEGIKVDTQMNAEASITAIESGLRDVSSQRSKLGAFQNRLEHTINNLGTSAENLTAAESRIRDVDMAKEMMSQTKNSILSQAAQAMLAQANQQPQGVLQLLR